MSYSPSLPIVHLVASPSTTSGAYSPGFVVGGISSLSNAARIPGGSGFIQQVSIGTKEALTAPFDVFFFDTNPTNGVYTDNSGISVGSDTLYLAGVAHCTDLISGGVPQILQASNLAIPFQLSSGTVLYSVIVMRGTETFTSTSEVNLNVLIQQN